MDEKENENTELFEWARDEADQLYHTGYTFDRHGDMQRSKMKGRRETLIEILDRFGDGYEHDPDLCKECAELDELMDELHGDN